MSEVTEGADERFVRYAELADYGIPFSPQHLMVLERRGDFPRRVKLSPRVVAWRLSELRRWMNSRPAADPAEPVARRRLEVGR